MKLDKILNATNLAIDLDDDKLIEIGNDVVQGYELDAQTRTDWEEDLKNWTELALQITKQKDFPWKGAANIKYPLLATAAMQFAARAYPTLVPSNGQIVKCRVAGFDMDGQKTERADRISKHMSYQVLEEMEDWEEDMDKLLITLPIAGTCFKKTYWDSAKQRNCSKLVLPKSLVVNYYCRNINDAERVTELFYLSQRKLKERQNLGIYRDVDLGTPESQPADLTTSVNNAFQNNAPDDETTPYLLLEQHTYIDLDEDGYAEPYIVTVEATSKEVLRIVPRFSESGVTVNEKGKVAAIEPIQYYTKYGFIPNPDGGFYDIGFGRLLGPLNNSANTIINQLVDAGSLSNLQAGFIGKGLRIKMGTERFQPGEWKAVNAIGDDLKKQIFPLPVREPSQVLFNLLDLLLKSGKELASVAEIFVGKMPGQNTPATTTMASIEQGMKVFTAVYKRIYRSLTSEFRKIYRLNREYLNPEEYISVLDLQVQQSDYDSPEDDIIPGADPTAVSSQEKQARVQAIMQLMQLGTINPMAVTKLYLEAHEIPNPEQYMMQPQPKQDPKVEAMQMKAQIDAQKAQNDIQISQEKLKMEQMSKEQELQHKAALQHMELQGKQMEGIIKGRAAEAQMRQVDMQHQQQMQQQAQQTQMNMATQQVMNQQKLQHQAQADKQKLQSSKVKEKKPNATSNSK
jgi:chaperonin GroES